MAFSVAQRIRVVDQSSAYRNMFGTVKTAVDDDGGHDVQLEGHGCNGRVRFLADQLAADGTAARVSYAQCAG